ncbi:MAG: DUF1080 domain-containing protein [Candidatus Cloacimonetes bacterium]|nr:DUF1080 domain-containing protein [Candidatus Cloacimonadota bacterium]
MKYFILISAMLFLLSCSKSPVWDNPYDTNCDLPEPENVQIENISLTTIKVTWEYGLDNIEGFKINHKYNGVWQEDEIVAADQHTFTEENVPLNEDFQYSVTAFAGNNFSDTIASDIFSNVIPEPSTLSYNRLSINRVALSWIDNSEGEQGFKLDKKVGNNEWLVEYSVHDENIQTWIDNNAEIGMNLQYRVYAYYGEIESASTKTVISNNEIPIPENLSLEKLITNEIRLSWDYNMPGIDGFLVEKKPYGFDWETYSNIIGDGTRSWIDNNANNYDIYRLIAYYQNITSSPSNEAQLIIGFNENFNDDIADNWINDNSGRWQVYNNEYRMNGEADLSDALSYYDEIFDDFVYEADLRKLSGNYAFALYFRGDGIIQNTDYKNGYIFDVDGQSYLIGKNVNGTFYALNDEWTNSYFLNESGEVNHLKVICQGPNLSFYINGNLVDTIWDDTFSDGFVGLWAYDGSNEDIAIYDNINLSVGIESTSIGRKVSPRVIEREYSYKSNTIVPISK